MNVSEKEFQRPLLSTFVADVSLQSFDRYTLLSPTCDTQNSSPKSHDKRRKGYFRAFLARAPGFKCFINSEGFVDAIFGCVPPSFCRRCVSLIHMKGLVTSTMGLQVYRALMFSLIRDVRMRHPVILLFCQSYLLL